MAGGFLHQMHKTLESNRAMLKKSSYFELKTGFVNEMKKTVYQYKEATPEQLATIKNNMRINQANQLRKNLIKLGLAITTSIMLLMLMVYYIMW